MNEIQAVLFDFGMVLSLPPDPAAWARMRAITGLSESDLYREYWAHRHAYDRGDLTGETYWHKAAKGAGIALDRVQLADLLVADVDLWTQLNLPMVEWAQRLQRAGIRTGILSNMPDAMEAGHRRKIRVAPRLRPQHLVPRPQYRQARSRHLRPRRRRPQDRPRPILFIDDARTTSKPPSPPACRPSSTATTTASCAR